ncbi:MAG: type IV toxin-antitoxin system AbiEi family antitoxin domain-containing protein [Sphingobium sp.]
MKEGDRLAVGLLRGTTGLGRSEVHDAFAGLRTQLRDAGLHVLEPEAVILGADEGQILGWLALLQRQRLEPALKGSRIVTDQARRCAGHLLDLGIRLDYHHAIQSVASGEFASRLKALGWDVESPDTLGLAESARQKVLKALSERGPLRTAEITALGVSRQMLVTMVKSGQIRRVRYGVYGVNPKDWEEL